MVEKFKILSAGGGSKGLNIFKSTSYKEHEREPMAQLFWTLRWNIGIWLVCAMAFGLSFVIEHIWRYGWSPATAHWTSIFLGQAFTTFGMSVIASVPAWLSRSLFLPDIMCIVPLFPIIAFYFMSDATLTSEFNPHGKDKFDEKSARKANADDIKKMATKPEKNKNGLFGGFMMVLGYFKNKGKNEALKMDECLSALLLAPAGTGKTVGVVIPTILECDDVSMIINDPKPELIYTTSLYRASIGPVFIIDWGAKDQPENGLYYPAWNPLSPENMPFDDESRNTYIQIIVNSLIEEARGSADPHWSQSGRAALTGFINFIVSKVERAKADDYFYSRLQAGEFNDEDASVLADYYMTMGSSPNAYAAMGLLQRGELNAMNYVHVGTWADIPDEWVGHEASIPLYLAWYTQSQLKIGEELEERRRQGDQMVALADPMKDFLNQAVEEARLYSYNKDAVSALLNLANTPDRERGSIISTVNAGLNIFRHPAVNKHTSHSDFHFSDLRGMVDPRDGKMKPTTVYLAVNVADATAFAPITSMFIELLSNYLIANPPNSTKGDVKNGPYPALFVLDEMPTMNRLEAIIRGPAVGRGQKVSYLIVGQDISQIAEKYGDKAADTIVANTAAKVILRVNDPSTAQRFSDMMGTQIKMKKTKGADGKEVESPESKPLYQPMDLMTLNMEKQIVLYQGFYNRPIEATQERWYKNKSPIEQSLYNKVMMGLDGNTATSPVPDFLIPAHHAAMGYDGEPSVFDPREKILKPLTSK